MKSKSLILMFVSLGFGLVAAIGISQVLGRSGGSGNGIRTGPVLVAVDHIDINTELTEELFSVEEWPVNIIKDNNVRTIEELSNKVAVRSIVKGAPLTLSDMIDKNDSGMIAIKKGQRLISIKVNPDDVMNGLMKPGDYVDVIGIFEKKEGLKTTTYSATFLKKIQVYSVNETTSAEGPREAAGAKQNSIVGVVVNQKQAEQLALVQSVGKLRLMLCSQFEDDDAEPDPLPSFLFGDAAAEAQTAANDFGSDENNHSEGGLLSKMLSSTTSQNKNEPFVMEVWEGNQKTKFSFNSQGDLVEPEVEGSSKGDANKANAFGEFEFGEPELDSPPPTQGDF
ncbi:MAG: Flp pilus assembly protein CpaB [Pirellulaceae bacterium]